MRIKVGGVTYTGIKEKSPAWYIWKTLQAIGLILETIILAFLLWAFAAATIIILG